MSGHDYDQNTAPSAAHERIIAPKGGGQSAEPEIRRPAVDDTWKKIEQILRQDSKASDDLARLVSLLDADHMNTFATEHFATLGQRASGDVVVDVGRVLEPRRILQQFGSLCTERLRHAPGLAIGPDHATVLDDVT